VAGRVSQGEAVPSAILVDCLEMSLAAFGLQGVRASVPSVVCSLAYRLELVGAVRELARGVSGVVAGLAHRIGLGRCIRRTILCMSRSARRWRHSAASSCSRRCGWRFRGLRCGRRRAFVSSSFPCSTTTSTSSWRRRTSANCRQACAVCRSALPATSMTCSRAAGGFGQIAGSDARYARLARFVTRYRTYSPTSESTRARRCLPASTRFRQGAGLKAGENGPQTLVAPLASPRGRRPGLPWIRATSSKESSSDRGLVSLLSSGSPPSVGADTGS
jgi:hypothetical protein